MLSYSIYKAQSGAFLFFSFLASSDLNPRHVQRLGIDEDDLAGGGEGGDGDEPHGLAVFAADHLGAELGLAADEVEVRTGVHDEGVVVLEGVAPWRDLNERGLALISIIRLLWCVSVWCGVV